MLHFRRQTKGNATTQDSQATGSMKQSIGYVSPVVQDYDEAIDV
jgi:hypothetical protein